MTPMDWVWTALGLAVFLAAMGAVIWLTQRNTRAAVERELAGRTYRFKDTMSDEQLVMALSQLGESHPAWVAMNQIVLEQIEYAIAEAMRPDLATQPGAQAFNAGGIYFLRDLQMELIKAHNGDRLERRAA